MSHTLNGRHLSKKARRPDSAVLILVVLSLLFGVMLSMPDAEEKTGKPVALRNLTEQSAIVSIQSEPASQETAAFMVRVDQEFSRLTVFDPLYYTMEPRLIGEALAVINHWTVLIHEAAALDLMPDQRQRVLEFRREVIAGQKRFFPTLRNQYGPAMQQKVAKHNVGVSTSDTDHTTIEFVGSMFNSVGYQRGFTEMMWPILRQLRFKKIQFREYRSQDTFASWNIQSPEDDVLVVWERDANEYRVVE